MDLAQQRSEQSSMKRFFRVTLCCTFLSRVLECSRQIDGTTPKPLTALEWPARRLTYKAGSFILLGNQ